MTTDTEGYKGNRWCITDRFADNFDNGPNLGVSMYDCKPGTEVCEGQFCPEVPLDGRESGRSASIQPESLKPRF